MSPSLLSPSHVGLFSAQSTLVLLPQDLCTCCPGCLESFSLSSSPAELSSIQASPPLDYIKCPCDKPSQLPATSSLKTGHGYTLTLCLSPTGLEGLQGRRLSKISFTIISSASSSVLTAWNVFLPGGLGRAGSSELWSQFEGPLGAPTLPPPHYHCLPSMPMATGELLRTRKRAFTKSSGRLDLGRLASGTGV